MNLFVLAPLLLHKAISIYPLSLALQKLPMLSLFTPVMVFSQKTLILQNKSKKAVLFLLAPIPKQYAKWAIKLLRLSSSKKWVFLAFLAQANPLTMMILKL